MTTSRIIIEAAGKPTEVVASGLSAERAHDLASEIRRRLKPGERLVVESAEGFTVIEECK